VFVENSADKNFFTPALVAASATFFYSKNPPAPRIDTTPSCLLNAESKLDSKQVFLTSPDVGWKRYFAGLPPQN
jgi:hypothetical protein